MFQLLYSVFFIDRVNSKYDKVMHNKHDNTRHQHTNILREYFMPQRITLQCYYSNADKILNIPT